MNPARKNPELDNPLFIQCVAEKHDELIDCNVNCVTDTDCIDGCMELFKEEMKDCPCMENCQMGCPCKTGFNCEPYITAMCQAYNSNEVDFSYSISASGHNKGTSLKYELSFLSIKFLNLNQQNRHYTTPAKTNYQFLTRSGFSILNGEVYIFGGDQDPKKVNQNLEF